MKIFIALLLSALAASAQIGRETPFTRSLKTNENAAGWRARLGVTNAESMDVSGLVGTNAWAQTNLILEAEIDVVESAVTGVSNNLVAVSNSVEVIELTNTANKVLIDTNAANAVIISNLTIALAAATNALNNAVAALNNATNLINNTNAIQDATIAAHTATNAMHGLSNAAVNVQIGTNAANILMVSNNVVANTAGIAGIVSGTNDFLSKSAGGTVNNNVSISGNVGIGIVTPLSALHVRGAITTGSDDGTAVGDLRVYEFASNDYLSISGVSDNSFLWDMVGTTGLGVIEIRDFNLGIGGPPLGTGAGNLTVTNNIYANSGYFSNDVSALTFTDRSSSPKTKGESYEIVMSHKSTPGGKVDHSVLSTNVYGTKVVHVPTGRMLTNLVDEVIIQDGKPNLTNKVQMVSAEIRKELHPDPTKRDLSKMVSAQADVIQDLIQRLEELEKK